jgi:NitT/TauT family transport system ATP-binding protein
MTPATPTAETPTSGVGIRLSALSKVFPPDRAVLHRVDLTIRPGEFVAILGPSGCGKSTLLRMISGLEPPTSGALRLEVAGQDPPPPEISFVFQDAHLLPWRTVLENVKLPLEFRSIAGPERSRLAREALGRVGLADALDLFPNQLSGGMKMRVSLARALVTRPTLLILDEPFAALDEITRQRLDEQLRQLWHRLGMTVVFVTHSITEAVFLSQRVILLSRATRGVSLEVPVELADDRTGMSRASIEFARIVERLQGAFESLGAF